MEGNEKKMKTIEEQLITKERERSKRERFLSFDDRLRFLLYDINSTHREDYRLLDEVKQSIMIFVMKSNFEFRENNILFLESVKNDFYEAINKLKKRHPGICRNTLYIRLFMEDYYFNV